MFAILEEMFELAFLADLAHYALMRSVLFELK
jgi:hypothetical protein